MSDKLTATSSGNGYCKMPDGTLIQWGEVSQLVTFTAWQSWYESSFIDLGNFPMTFNGIPKLTASLIADDDTVSINASLSGVKDITATSAGKTRVYRPNDPGSFGIKVSWIAIGRWK